MLSEVIERLSIVSGNELRDMSNERVLFSSTVLVPLLEGSTPDAKLAGVTRPLA